MRTFPALVLTAGLVLSLGACSGGPAPLFGGCTPAFDSGDASSQVEASGEVGSAPTVDFPTPLYSDGTQVTELVAGEGEPLYPGQIVDFHISVHRATGGEEIVSTFQGESPARRTIAEGDDELGLMLQCTSIGSRVAAVSSIGDIFAASVVEENGLDPEEDVVLILEVVDAFLGKANGRDQLPQAGFPAIALAPNGHPGVTQLNEEPPTDLKIEVLKAGSGAEVEAGDAVVLHYSALEWGADSTFESTWEDGEPRSVTIPENAEQSGLQGFVQAVQGQRVGSQVVVIIPPEFGYGEGSVPAGVAADSTLIFVIDILGIE